MMVENDAVEAETTIAENDGNTSPENDKLEVEIEGKKLVEAVDGSETAQPEAEPEQSNKRKKWQPSPALRQVISWFAACGRCSFFLAGYGLIDGEDVLETAVSNRGKKWLTVSWSHDLSQLVHKTYGSRIDVTCYHFAGQCKECHRRFTYQASEKEDEPATFRIELRP
jgi:hypothetical protein